MQSEVLSFSGLQTVVSDPIYPTCMTIRMAIFESTYDAAYAQRKR